MPFSRTVLARFSAVMVGMLVAASACKDESPPTAASLTVTPATVSLTSIGGTASVTAAPKDGSGASLNSAEVTWSSDVPSIATVTQSGLTATITAVSRGNTTIRARSGSVYAAVAVQVGGVREVIVSPTVSAIRVGDAQPLTAAVVADPGLATTVTWSSENAAVATVSNTGVVTAVSVGTAVIRATSTADAKFSGIATITVAAARNVTVAPTTLSLVAGATSTLVPTVRIDAGQSTAVTWRTSAATVATVSATGVVTAVANGTATITAVSVADTLLRGTALVTVLPSVRTVTVTPTTAAVFIGATQAIVPTVTVDGTVATTVTWRSSVPTVASVSADGVVTGVAAGTSVITAVSTADTTKRATATITVSSRPITVGIVQRNVSINPGRTFALTANVIGDPGISTAVNWTSSASAVATISSAGVVSAISAGSTLITATSQADITKRDTLTVFVVPTLATTWTSARMNGPLIEDVTSIVGFNSTSAFGVNSNGDVYIWNGTTWAISLRGASFTTKFVSVHGTASNNVIAVGDRGAIVRFDGTQWTQMVSGTTRDLKSVWVENQSVAIAVGANGTTLRLVGTQWTTTTSNTTEQLNGVWSLGGTAFAVGTNGTVLRYNGTAWSFLAPPTTQTLNAVSGTTTTNIMVVGSLGTALRFDGTNWTLVSSNGNGGDMWGIFMTNVAPFRSYIASDNGLLQYDGTNITPVPTPYVPATFSVNVDQSGIIWMSGQRGIVERSVNNTGATWETLSIAPDLLDVWSTAANNSWVVGEYGFIYRFNGTTWARQVAPTTAMLNTVWAPSATDAFVGGDNGTMLRWNGSTWATMASGTTANIRSIWGSGSTNVFAVTDANEVLRFNGTAWSVVATSARPLVSVFGVSPTEVYVGGAGGVMLRLNGGVWGSMPSVANGTVAGLFMSGFTDILAVGGDGAGTGVLASRFNGTSWQTLSPGTTRVLTSVWGPSVSDVYVTGDSGTLLRYTGTTWTSLTTGTTDLLWSVSGSPNGTGAAFAVGYNSTLVTGTNGANVAAMRAPTVGELEPSPAAMRARATTRGARPALSGVARMTRKSRTR